MPMKRQLGVLLITSGVLGTAFAGQVANSSVVPFSDLRGTDVTASFGALQPSQANVGQIQVASSSIAAMEHQVWLKINQIRRQQGRAALRRNRKLDEVARRHSENMRDRNFFSHGDHRGDSAFERVEDARIPFQLVAENLAWNQNSTQPVDRAVKGWMTSPGHRRNILEPRLRETGIGIAKEGNSYFFTQVFIRKP